MNGIEPRGQNLLEINEQRLESRVAVFRVELQHLHHEVVNLRRKPRTDLAGLARRPFKTLAHHGVSIIPLEGCDSAQRVINSAAKRIHIGAVIDWLLLHLLRSDVIRRSPDLVGVFLHRRQTEIDQFGVTVSVEKHILGLNIAVHQPLVRRTAQRLGDLLANLQHPRHVRIGAGMLHDLVQRAAGNQFHCDIRHAVEDVVGIDLRDIRVNQPRGGLGFLFEFLNETGITTVFLEHHLHCHGTIEHLVTPHVDATHSAATQLALKQKIVAVSENARRRNQEFFTHRMILHPLNGQKTTLPTPRRLSPGTGPQ